jgi:transcriptional regulator with XRE-family HTH domain
MNRRVLGPAIKAIREALGISGTDFAGRCRISPSHLNHIEAGRKQPSPAIARRFATELGVPLEAVTYPITEEKAA